MTVASLGKMVAAQALSCSRQALVPVKMAGSTRGSRRPSGTAGQTQAVTHGSGPCWALPVTVEGAGVQEVASY